MKFGSQRVQKIFQNGHIQDKEEVVTASHSAGGENPPTSKAQLPQESPHKLNKGQS